jgi:TonB family protein
MGMKKILVIDYDQASLQALHKTLTQEGFEIVLASDGQAGWEKFQSEDPDLVLMEAMLSKIHGFELCDRITKNPVRKVPVFIMTGVYKDRVYRTEALRTYGASEYFEKPLDMLKFLASIHAVLTVPDIKPEPEAEPTNGQEQVSVAKPPVEEPRWTEAPAEARAPRAEALRPKPAHEVRTSSGGGGLSLETMLNVRTAKETPPKAKTVPEPKSRLDDELQLESLLKDIAVAAQEHHRPGPAKSGPAVAIAPKAKEAEKPHEHAGKENEAADIDRLLKTTLADFGLEAEKKKPAKPVAPPAPAPAPEKPRQAAAVFPAAQPKPKPVAPPPPPPAPPVVATQEKPKPVVPPSPTPAVAEKPKPPQPAPHPVPQQAKPKPAPQPAPAKPKPAPRPEPAAAPKAESREAARKPEPQKSADARMFKDIYEVEKKKSPVPFIAVGAGLVVVAVVGFFLLRPKHNANPTAPGLTSPTTQMQSSAPEKTPDTTLPSLSEEKLRTVNPKPKAPPQTARQAEPLPTAEDAIAPPPIADVSRLNAKAAPEKKPAAKPAEPKQGEVKPAETKAGDAQTANVQAPVQTQAQPPAGTETTAPQGSAGGGSDTSGSPIPASKANPGDLVDLAAVDEAPKLTKSFDPLYPAQAARFGKEGSVTVNALISETGAVTEARILKGLKDDMGLEKAAVDAVKKWKFQPAKKDGVNVKVWKPVVVTFKANRIKTP